MRIIEHELNLRWKWETLVFPMALKNSSRRLNLCFEKRRKTRRVTVFPRFETCCVDMREMVYALEKDKLWFVLFISRISKRRIESIFNKMFNNIGNTCVSRMGLTDQNRLGGSIFPGKFPAVSREISREMRLGQPRFPGNFPAAISREISWLGVPAG